MSRRAEVRLAGTALEGCSHICAFFHSKDEQYDTLLPFIREGLEHRQKAVHIVDGQGPDPHLVRLQRAGIDTTSARGEGRLEVLTWKDAYLQGGRFDQYAMLKLLRETLDAGRRQGYPLTRLTADMEWALEDLPGVADLVEYEARVNQALCQHDDAVICVYDVNRFGAGVMLDILRTHPLVLVGGVLKVNNFYVPPEEFLRELSERRRADGEALSGGIA